jgi:chemotaxis protein MotB
VARENSESGMLVYPRMPVSPAKRESAPRVKKMSTGGGTNKRMIAVIASSVVGGGLLGFFVRPAVTTDPEVSQLHGQVGEFEQKYTSARTRADDAERERDAAQKAKQDLEAKLKDAQVSQKTLSDKDADAAKKKSDLEAVQTKLKNAVDRSVSSVSIDGDDVHIAILDRALFKPGDDALSDGGKHVLDKLAGVLKDLSDKQIGVQGHTDDQPVPAPKAAAAAVVPKGAKPAAKPATPTPGKPMTNWELSSSRALAVVHYLQDTSRIDPTRLVAIAFGQYRPISKTNKALNRRIEFVLAPKKKS